MKKVFEGFSVKKLLLSILCTTIVMIFIGFTTLFVPFLFDYTLAEIIEGSNKNSEIIKDMGYNMQENYNIMKKEIEEQKEAYGNEFPAEGVLIYEIILRSRSHDIVNIYTMCLLVGITFGTLIYIIFIQKAKGSQMVLEAIICGIIILLLIALINIGYNTVVNIGINYIGIESKESTYGYILFDNYAENIIGIYAVIIILAFFINYVNQKNISNKLNKKLNKK